MDNENVSSSGHEPGSDPKYSSQTSILSPAHIYPSLIRLTVFAELAKEFFIKYFTNIYCIVI